RIVREYLEKSFTERINRAQERAMSLAGEAVDRPEYRLAADEALRHVGELERARDERRAGLKRLELARTGPGQHVASALVLAPGGSVAEQIAELGPPDDADLRRRIEKAAEAVVVADLIAEGFPADRIELVGHLKIGFDVRAHRVRDHSTGELEV